MYNIFTHAPTRVGSKVKLDVSQVSFHLGRGPGTRVGIARSGAAIADAEDEPPTSRWRVERLQGGAGRSAVAGAPARGLEPARSPSPPVCASARLSCLATAFAVAEPTTSPTSISPFERPICRGGVGVGVASFDGARAGFKASLRHGLEASVSRGVVLEGVQGHQCYL